MGKHCTHNEARPVLTIDKCGHMWRDGRSPASWKRRGLIGGYSWMTSMSRFVALDASVPIPLALGYIT